MLKKMPGSVALYAPGKATRGPGVPDPPPFTLICAHETKNWAPLKLAALWTPRCSMRSR